MTTITAEILPASAAVRLTVDAPAGIRSLVRTDANGAADVRTLPGVLETVPPANTPFIFTDYEPAHGPLRYDVTDMAGTIVSLDVAGFVLAGPWLFTPIIPGYSRRVETVTGLDTGFGDLSTVHSGLLGRPDPIVIMRPLGTRAGTLELYAGTYAAALELLSPLRQGTVMMLRQPEHPGMDMYFAPAGGTPQIVTLTVNGDRTVFGVRVPYIEVRRPEGPLAGALGWTFADLAAADPTFAGTRRAYATFADLRLNKRKTT